MKATSWPCRIDSGQRLWRGELEPERVGLDEVGHLGPLLHPLAGAHVPLRDDPGEGGAHRGVGEGLVRPAGAGAGGGQGLVLHATGGLGFLVLLLGDGAAREEPHVPLAVLAGLLRVGLGRREVGAGLLGGQGELPGVELHHHLAARQGAASLHTGLGHEAGGAGGHLGLLGGPEGPGECGGAGHVGLDDLDGADPGGGLLRLRRGGGRRRPTAGDEEGGEECGGDGSDGAHGGSVGGGCGRGGALGGEAEGGGGQVTGLYLVPRWGSPKRPGGRCWRAPLRGGGQRGRRRGRHRPGRARWRRRAGRARPG